MKERNRMIGMIVCLLLLIIGAVLYAFTPFVFSGYSLIGFASGWALRETLENKPLEDGKL